MTNLVKLEVMTAILQGDCRDPFATLGMHPGSRRGQVVRVFWPGALKVEVIDRAVKAPATRLSILHEAGFFAGTLPDRSSRFPYLLRITTAAATIECEDPYRFTTILKPEIRYRLATRTPGANYEILGAHFCLCEDVAGVCYAVWAPNAFRVSVVGDFNDWDGRRHVMRFHADIGVWEIFLPGQEEGGRYMFEIRDREQGSVTLKADPLAFRVDLPPDKASQLFRTSNFAWNDAGWLTQTSPSLSKNQPVCVYEVHLGSWRRPEGRETSFLSYGDLADRLIPYTLDMGFTHLQIMPIAESPFYGSWGYQPTALFAPSARYGSPADFAAFVDRCHGAGLGLILDWVPAHFPRDDHGLAYFDGSYLYEYEDPRLGFHPDWGTLVYNFGSERVADFLIDNALFWLDRYHLDGLRADAVASMIYRDFSRPTGEWIANADGGKENWEAMALLQRLNRLVRERFPGRAIIAEDSSIRTDITLPADQGGLGFAYRWNLGWMHDTLNFLKRDPIYRKYHHEDLVRVFDYAFDESWILPLSHDEVVYGKGSLLARMPGDRWQQLANLRAYFGLMWAHPGKKLMFMGGEFAQEAEWHHERGLDWQLLDDPGHAGMQRLVRDLNRLYRQTPALHRKDHDRSGFRWVRRNAAAESLLAFLRLGNSRDQPALIVCNFTPVPRPGYRFGVPSAGTYEERLNTDAAVYGGSNYARHGRIAAEAIACDGFDYSLQLDLPPLSSLVLVRCSEGRP